MNTKNSEILKIKDNNTLFFALPNFLAVIFVTYVAIFNPWNANTMSIALIVIVLLPTQTMPYVTPYFKYKNKRFVELDNQGIRFTQENIVIESINLNDKFEVYKTFDVCYHKSQEATQSQKANALFIFMSFVTMPIMIFMYVAFIIMKFFYHIYMGGLKSYRLYDAVVVLQDDKIINILPSTNEEFHQVKNYFLQNFNIDIEKAPRYFNKFGHGHENIKEIGEDNE